MSSVPPRRWNRGTRTGKEIIRKVHAEGQVFRYQFMLPAENMFDL